MDSVGDGIRQGRDIVVPSSGHVTEPGSNRPRMNADIRVAVLGCGSIGRRHARNVAALGVTQIMCCDPVDGVAQEVADEFGVAAISDLDRLWEWRPDAAIVAAPTALHIPLASAAVEHGCDVFIEKPLSHSIEDAEELCAAAERAGAVTFVACNMRFHPGPTAVKRLLGTGEIGRVQSSRIQTGSYLPRWRPGSDYRQSYSASPDSGGAVLDCIHEIDLALWYHGPARLAAAAVRPAASLGLGVDGLAELLLEHETGVLSSVHLNFVQRDYRRCCQIIGERGTIYWDFGDGVVRGYGEDGVERLREPQPPAWEPNTMYLDEMRHFLDCVKARTQTVNPLAGGIAALRIATAARSGQWLTA